MQQLHCMPEIIHPEIDTPIENIATKLKIKLIHESKNNLDYSYTWESELTRELVKEGMNIHYTEDVNLIPDNFRNKACNYGNISRRISNLGKHSHNAVTGKQVIALANRYENLEN